jgi:hypothetical protein
MMFSNGVWCFGMTETRERRDPACLSIVLTQHESTSPALVEQGFAALHDLASAE